MKLAFWRRPRGRHALGAAVTSIPSAVVETVLIPATVPVPEPVPEPVPAPVPVPALVPVQVVDPQPEVVVPALAAMDVGRVEVGPVPTGPRVELGFRDGSRTALDPASPQARALEDLAAVLTRRD